MTALSRDFRLAADTNSRPHRLLACLGSPIGRLVIAVAAFWPVWTYLVRSWILPSADLGPAAVAAIVLGWVLYRTLISKKSTGNAPDIRFTAGLLGVYAVAYPQLPALARAMLALGIFGIALLGLPKVGTRGNFGLIALCLLTAPSIATLNFFVGAPLRAATTQFAAGWLLLTGAPAIADGAMLNVDGTLFSVDAPCSGVNGLWSGLVAAALFSLRFRLTPVRTTGLLAAAVLLCVPTNAWRAASLIRTPYAYVEAGTTAHTLIGLAAFAAMLLALHYLASKLAIAEEPSCLRPPEPPSPRSAAVFAVVALAAGLVPLLPTAGRAQSTFASFPGWPATWAGQPLRPLPKSAIDRRWGEIAGSPIARFALPAGDELLLRWTDQPGRWVHPPEDCYKGEGFEIAPLSPVRMSVEGAKGEPVWHRFEARKGAEAYEVSSIIVSTNAETYPDPGWWWWRVAGPGATDRGPWWIATIQSRSE